MEYEITHDAEYIKYCLTHPAVWRHVCDDGLINIDPRLYFPPMEGVIYVKAEEYGIILGRRLNLINYDVHIALLPSARGRAVEICKGAIEWFFNINNLPIRLNASVPTSNVHVINLIEKIGMRFIGINHASFMLNGVLHDQYLYGLSKEDLCQH